MGFLLAGCSDEPGDIKVDKNAPRKVIALTQAEEQVCQQSTLFGWNLFKHWLETANTDEVMHENLVISPYAATLNLSMFADGSSDAQREQIYRVLGFNLSDKDAVNSYNKAVSSQLNTLDKSTILRVVNTLGYSSSRMTMNPDFMKSMQDNYDVDAFDFDQKDAMQKLNDWMKKKTNGFLDYSFKDGNTNIVTVINALYFNGEWTTPFKKSQSRQLPFYNWLSEQPVNTNFMCRDMNVATYEDDDFAAIELPFGNGTYAMTFIMPKDGKTVLETLDAIIAKNWTPSQVTQERYALIKIPTFDICSRPNKTHDTASIKVWQRLGLSLSPDELTNMLTPKEFMRMSTFMHTSVRFAVKEEGAEAASVTWNGQIYDQLEGMPDDVLPFTCDHPFMYVLSECSTHTVLFTGAITKL